jgi:hypothetical protein
VGFHAGDLASGEDVLHEGGGGVHGENSERGCDRHICGRISISIEPVNYFWWRTEPL